MPRLALAFGKRGEFGRLSIQNDFSARFAQRGDKLALMAEARRFDHCSACWKMTGGMEVRQLSMCIPNPHEAGDGRGGRLPGFRKRQNLSDHNSYRAFLFRGTYALKQKCVKRLCLAYICGYMLNLPLDVGYNHPSPGGSARIR